MFVSRILVCNPTEIHQEANTRGPQRAARQQPVGEPEAYPAGERHGDVGSGQGGLDTGGRGAGREFSG